MNSSKPTMNRGNCTLKISLAAPQGWSYIAGDAVIGIVSRHAPTVTSEATVKLALRGRVKTQVTKGSGAPYDRHQEGPIYKQLLLPEQHTLFQGPLHIPDNNDSVYWPFEIRMSPYSQDSEFQFNGDLLPSWEEIASSRLPGTFCSVGSSSSACWVEYYLEAEMRYVERGEQKVYTSTCPVQVRHSPDTIFTGFGRQRRTLNRSIRGQQLLSVVHHEERSFVRRTREFFIHPSNSAPELHYKVEVYAPATVQLGNLSNIPYKLKFELLPQTSNALRGIELKVLFNSAKFVIRSETRVTAGTSVHSPSSIHCSLVDLGLEEAFRRLDAFPLMIPLTDKSQTLNLGKMLQLTLHASGLKAGEKDVAATGHITPTFSTHTLRHLNTLQAEFSVTVAGYTTRLHASTPMNILAEL
ncbi:hypothetical protein N7448_006123 [Penicillium atrosanguineum]|uniref:Arrestin-like N-terminal domain-containing protein n=1 Tax=Penicillium atrosanguineum TaxID=1132637 RepID=A0A9W9GXR1_9EURO|nr:siderophore iron transporter [Penicillium atrosanguineum]KAJ5131965.1 hypothetical protein N7448_006123 [Penicillium atrosanguineum]KAJ5137825.1 hypothetical protein N7526_004058 [Penicillium atrosanguineum]KAJ5289631.1 siderophore iron transporter [Penicillium atrosanguineum]KAJ5307450.1 hypothetical protein N7476_008106 [Penicillium atrosanguineum]